MLGEVPEALRERLGDHGTLALVELLDSTGRAWSEDVLTTAAEQFGRRLGEESGALRLEMATGFGALRQEMGQMQAELHDKMGQMQLETATGFAAVRQDMGQMRADVRDEIGQVRTALHDEIGKVRAELHEHIAGLRGDFRGELATARVDLIKWSFVFWIGQLVALSSVMALMLRSAGR